MPIKMKALKDFRGREGEGNVRGNKRMVESGVEFNVADQKRADWLEAQGLAVPMFVQKAMQPLQNKMEPAPANKAAQTGPLASPGGPTGADNPPSSSPPGRQPRRRESRKPGGGLDL